MKDFDDLVPLEVQAIRLALAAPYGRGADTKDVMALAAQVVAEIVDLRAKMTALTGALDWYIQHFDTSPAQCPCCTAGRSCEFLNCETDCDGEHPCKPGCMLSAAWDAYR